jgi:hypothetical protein
MAPWVFHRLHLPENMFQLRSKYGSNAKQRSFKLVFLVSSKSLRANQSKGAFYLVLFNGQYVTHGRLC